MAQKTVKSKRPTTAKKTTVKKTAAARPVVKKAAPVAPVQEMHTCGCGAHCGCGHNCACGAPCACTHKRRGGFGRFIRKLLVLVVFFALGFATARLCPECGRKFGRPDFRGPRVHFVNGCLDTAAVKCPKLAAALPAMDINQDGCITRDEYRAVKKKMRREIREMDVREENLEIVDEIR